jgi:hypothetical protein
MTPEHECWLPGHLHLSCGCVTEALPRDEVGHWMRCQRHSRLISYDVDGTPVFDRDVRVVAIDRAESSGGTPT